VLKHGRFGIALGTVGEANFSKLSHESTAKVGQKYAKVKKPRSWVITKKKSERGQFSALVLFHLLNS
jgi:hypothetical protein